jgi:DNA-directed RNA polymerase omega subunit
MARISNTKGTKNVGGSRYELIMMASTRARSYSADNQPLTPHFNKRGMTALREIEAGLISIDEHKEIMVNKYRQHFPKEVDPILDN